MRQNLPLLIILFIMFPLSLSITSCFKGDTFKVNTKYTISGGNSMMGEIPDVNFSLSSTLPDSPDQLQIYKMVFPDITEEYVIDLGAKFSLTGEISEGTKNFLLSDDERRIYLEVYKPTGAFKFSNYPKLYPSSESVLEKHPVLPSDPEALKIATDFLAERDLLPAGDIAYKVEVGDSFGNIPTALLVSFDHSVDIIGPGARHGVRIGDKGEVVQVFINPTNPVELPPHEMADVKTVQQAYEEINLSKNYFIPSQAKLVDISEVNIAYWLEAIDQGQEFVVPVYVFRGVCLDENDNQLIESFVAVIEAIE
jgi:hypothetical protein